jgi:hypothetical protein
MPKGQDLRSSIAGSVWIYLQTVGVGRLVFTEDALPAVRLVNFRLWRDYVVIWVAAAPSWPPTPTPSSWLSRPTSWIQTCAQAGV